MSDRMKGVLGVLAAIALYSLSLLAKESAWSARKEWPISAQTVLAPGAAPVLGGLLGRELAADLLWIRCLVYNGSGIEETGAYDQLEQFIDAITALDPKFRRVYRWGAYQITYRGTTATQEEFRLSVKFLEQGMKHFPSQYELFWLAGLRYYLDFRSEDEDQRRRDKERGAELIEQAMHKPDAPPALATLAASLRSKLGQRDRAIADLRQMILITDSPVARDRMVARLRALTNEDVAQELLDARQIFDQEKDAHLPLAPSSLFVILGPTPDPVINFDRLATDRDLFGAAKNAPSRP